MTCNPRVQHLIASIAEVFSLTIGPLALADLEVSLLDDGYQPDPQRVPIQQSSFDPGGNTSVRNTSSAELEWKEQGYYQRNRDLGQVFTVEWDFWLEGIVLRTGPAEAAVLAGVPGAEVFVQFFAVTGAPTVRDKADVDTYRDLVFSLEVSWTDPATSRSAD